MSAQITTFTPRRSQLDWEPSDTRYQVPISGNGYHWIPAFTGTTQEVNG